MRAVRHLAKASARRLWLFRNQNAFRDRGPSRKPRLFVDVSVIIRHDAGTGIQRVVRSVWSNLVQAEADGWDVVPVYATVTHGYCFAPTDFLTHRTSLPKVPVGLRPGDKFLGLDLSAHVLPYYSQQLEAWRANGASLHFVIYDLLPITRPDWFETATSQRFGRWLNTILRLGDQAVCISDSVAQEFRRRTIGTRAHNTLKVGRLHLSGDLAGSLPSVGFTPRVRSTLERARSFPTILMIGTVEPRKGYEAAINAFERLWEEAPDAPDLLVIGKPGWKTDALQRRIRTHPVHGRRLHWLEDVSDEALTQFYDASLAVFLASYDEGFGLPVVEAATHRRWALARDLPVFREQRLPNLLYFDDDSPDALARELTALVEMSRKGPPPPVSPQNWASCVNRLVEEIGLGLDFRTERPVLRLVS